MLRHRCNVVKWMINPHLHRPVCSSTLLVGQAVRRASTCHATQSEGHSSSGSNNSNKNNVQKREPHLRRLAVVRPDLVDEWVPELNDADVSSVPSTSPLDVWWRCPACGENYQAAVKDRAVADKGCPRCSSMQQREVLHLPQSVGGAGSTDAQSAVATASPSLAETHPELASRWDSDRNGLLRPSDVTCTSEVSVWWRPAEGRPLHEQSFRRPVYAFVEIPYSVQEQREAQAALETDILQQVRKAAKIEEARAHNAFPAAAYMLDDSILKSPHSGASGSPLATQNQQQHFDLVGEDLHKAIEMWERNFDAKTDEDFRPVFHADEARGGGEAWRDQVLTTYHRFVEWHKSQIKLKESSGSDNSNKGTDASVVPSAITDPDWVQHFTLASEDVAKGLFAPSAKLVLPDVTAPPVQQQQQQQTVQNALPAHRRIDSLPPPPEEYENEIRTTFAQPKRPYPRQPPRPPMHEEDVTESVPKTIETDQQQQQQQQQQPDGASASQRDAVKGRKSHVHHDAPVEAAFEVVSLATAQSLAQDYAASDDKSMPFDADEKDLHLRSLLGSVAMQSMTEEQARALQYNRGTPRPRRTGRFRLRMPVSTESRGKDGIASTLGVASPSSSSSATEEGTRKEQQRVIQAPGTPRKVARPKKKLNEAANEESTSSSAFSSGQVETASA
ncbi:hypothetical protein DQ04_08311000 [Trypanosoma grayi]|uniref:hypothetical protein n=1 Tax=Trypanosoma grayi TaxID=71804 RepID=UPI0004F46A58|nr:hypothetical protein DQ04_08311000 [Trypanosoma grayi]KEG07981.1 hypothetical protein DQ04_08311000 [Trypanosoma grayi]